MSNPSSQACYNGGTSRADGIASPIMLIRGGAKGSTQTLFVDLNTAAGLIENFLSALEAPATYRSVQLDYARIQANRKLASWGVARQPLPQGRAA